MKDKRSLLVCNGRWIFAFVVLLLVTYLIFKLLPDNAVDLPILIRTLPDLGLLTILILLLAIGWGAVRTAL